jgi:hypothetical protein
MTQTDQPTSPAGRDPKTGKLLNPISIDIHHAATLLPSYVWCRSWAAARKFLASEEFRAIADDVSFVTITNREQM